jgi:PilZ domain
MSAFAPETLPARIKRLLKERNFKRAFERHRCSIDVTMLCAPRMTSLSGRMIDISRGGGMFRPCLSYLMERRGAEGFIVAADQKIHVRIVRTLPVGYAVQFVDILSDEQLTLIRNTDPQMQEAA